MLIKRKNLIYNFAFVILFVLASCRSKNEVSKSNSGSEKELKNNSGKLSSLLGISEKEIKNKRIYLFVEEWYGTPYLFGGNSKSGTDCSGLTKNIYLEVYKKNLARTAGSQFDQCEKISPNNLKQGDLLFFKIESKSITHVGVYLINTKFVHASTKRGVMVSDLNENYFKKYFFAAGRPK